MPFQSRPTAAAGGPVLGGAAPASGRLLILAIALALSWSVALALMDALTIPPVVVSTDQVRSSAVVVSGRRAEEGENRIRVERAFRGEAQPGDELRILNLAAVQGLQRKRAYLFALKRFGRDYEVTTLPGQNAAPLVYPAEGEPLERVKSILRDDL
jgi:hypothetical protein